MKRSLPDIFSTWELEPILNSISDAIFIDDNRGYGIWCNKACEEMYEITAEQVRGMHVSELEREGIFSPSVVTIVMEQNREATIIHENKHGKKLLSTATPIMDSKGNITKIITTSRDISELSLLQTQLETSASEDARSDSDYFRSMGIIAFSEPMLRVLRLAQRLATVDSTVLISGESGVGKGIIAEFLHRYGNRRDKPFITVNCGAIPANLIESELFGYEKGAFTGARAEGKKGYFQAAQEGTIFLDEITELPLDLQVKLLQVIQERAITRVGGTEKIPVNVRIISATNRDLKQRVDDGLFREDLYYRLNVVPINVPPLRERQEDIRPLIDLFLDQFNKEYQQKKSITHRTLNILSGFSWPGNIRELQNIIERLVLTTQDDIIDVSMLPEFIIEGSSSSEADMSRPATLAAAVETAERSFLKDAARHYSSTREMARALKTSQPTIVRKLNKYGISLG
ncbi:MAG: sigma-54 interaction domain-containing protein [Anaerovoracaceae bacterium]|jgi:TyrR family helix-turn-helix protein